MNNLSRVATLIELGKELNKLIDKDPGLSAARDKIKTALKTVTTEAGNVMSEARNPATPEQKPSSATSPKPEVAPVYLDVKAKVNEAGKVEFFAFDSSNNIVGKFEESSNDVVTEVQRTYPGKWAFVEGDKILAIFNDFELGNEEYTMRMNLINAGLVDYEAFKFVEIVIENNQMIYVEV